MSQDTENSYGESLLSRLGDTLGGGAKHSQEDSLWAMLGERSNAPKHGLNKTESVLSTALVPLGQSSSFALNRGWSGELSVNVDAQLVSPYPFTAEPPATPLMPGEPSENTQDLNLTMAAKRTKLAQAERQVKLEMDIDSKRATANSSKCKAASVPPQPSSSRTSSAASSKPSSTYSHTDMSHTDILFDVPSTPTRGKLPSPAKVEASNTEVKEEYSHNGNNDDEDDDDEEMASATFSPRADRQSDVLTPKKRQVHQCHYCPKTYRYLKCKCNEQHQLGVISS